MKIKNYYGTYIGPLVPPMKFGEWHLFPFVEMQNIFGSPVMRMGAIATEASVPMESGKIVCKSVNS